MLTVCTLLTVGPGLVVPVPGLPAVSCHSLGYGPGLSHIQQQSYASGGWVAVSVLSCLQVLHVVALCSM
ncbi:hypothetical protein COO60DRAFT_701141 [Scenedesmus sp. NREL 46B-D3]|nr:hypothetical protein COO60DRAFT_701141 [Scenedesmus sp. NREL 46B-D3]